MNNVKDRILHVEQNLNGGTWNMVWHNIEYETCRTIYAKFSSSCTRIDIKHMIKDEFNE